jgi:hypothetical protein
MLYEYRRYKAAPGKMPALNQRFEDVTLGLFEKHGMKPTGFWNSLVGSTEELHYILEWESADQFASAWMDFVQDPAWGEAVASSEKDGPLLVTAENQLWFPTSYSPSAGGHG